MKQHSEPNNTKRQGRDIPLKNAMLAWTPVNFSHRDTAGKIEVTLVSDDGRPHNENRDLTHTLGACFTAWGKWTDAERLSQLYIDMWHIVCRDGLKPEDVHAALMSIPEYRNSLSGEEFFPAEAHCENSIELYPRGMKPAVSQTAIPFRTMADLIAIPLIASRASKASFHQFSMTEGNILLSEFSNGETWVMCGKCSSKVAWLPSWKGHPVLRHDAFVLMRDGYEDATMAVDPEIVRL